MDLLRPFVPRVAVDWLRDEPSQRWRTYEGTLVFADISGFTDLTEALAKRGQEGAEEIAGVVDAAFSELIRRAYAHQADLLKFGGDAILLLFQGDHHSERAAAAAVGMQEALRGMRRRSTSAGPVRLQMSVGVHSGLFHFFLVGGVHRELVIAGPGATTCVETEAVAKAGEIALSHATAELFDPSLLGERRDGVVVLAASPAAPETVPPFFDSSGVDLSALLPAAYTRELRGEPSDPEHRHVAVAFAELRGTDELLARDGPEALADALEERITAIQESCLAFDVTFAQTDVSKGAVKAILLAGAPRTAGGEEEELMLRTARAIVERAGVLPVRVGVNTGRVFAGIVGTLTRRTYTFYGDAINTAARIMVRAATGQVLAHEDVLERARTTYDTTPVEPFAAKGKAALVRASDVGAPVGEREQEAIGPFVGREPELDALLAALGRAGEGHGALALVTGDPGLGKTRLLGELCAQASGTRTLRVQCSSTGANHPYAAAGAIVLRALQLEPHAPAAVVERRLRAAVRSGGRELEPWLPLLGLVVGLSLPADARDRSPRGAVRRRAHRGGHGGASGLHRAGRDARRRRRRPFHGRGLGRSARAARTRHRGAPLAARARAPLGLGGLRCARGRRAAPRAARAARAVRRAPADRPADRGRAARSPRRGSRRGALGRQSPVRDRDGRGACARAPTRARSRRPSRV